MKTAKKIILRSSFYGRQSVPHKHMGSLWIPQKAYSWLVNLFKSASAYF